MDTTTLNSNMLGWGLDTDTRPCTFVELGHQFELEFQCVNQGWVGARFSAPGPRDLNPAPSRGPVDTPSINVTPSLDMNYILNYKISLQDQHCEFMENIVISYYCIKRCKNRSNMNYLYTFV